MCSVAETESSVTLLDTFGWSAFASAWPAEPDLFPARVVSQQRGQLDIYSEQGPARAMIRGSLLVDPPVVGDWVAVRPVGEQCLIVAILPRQTCITRKRAGGGHAQVIAANVDCVAVVTSMDSDFNLRRIERYLSVVRGAGCEARILLTKADRAKDSAFFTSQLSDPFFVCSALHGEGLDPLRAWVDGRTLALVGSSGVGKSTVINALVGQSVQNTGAVSDYDGQGQHTTTTRNLLRMPEGGCVIDTPGMRELGLTEDADPDEAFSDIVALASQCAYADCQHETEPKCAVRQAIESGSLDPKRLKSRDKLLRERAREARRSSKRLNAAAGKRMSKRVRSAARSKRNREG